MYKIFFKQIKVFVVFIGYARSGTTTIGFLLGVHPNIVISRETDVMRQSRYMTKNEVYSTIVRDSLLDMAVRQRRKRTLPTLRAGRFKKLLVIGNKRSEYYLRNPSQIDNLCDKFTDVSIKFIHVYRNPYDVITTKAKVSRNVRTFAERVDKYTKAVGGIDIIKQRVGKENVFDIQLEKFIENPKTILKELCGFLGVSAPSDYLDSCVKAVFKKPTITRHDIEWSEPLIKKVKQEINKVEHLKQYSYEICTESRQA